MVMPEWFNKEKYIEWLSSSNYKDLELGHVYSDSCNKNNGYISEGPSFRAVLNRIYVLKLSEDDFRFSTNEEELKALSVLHGYEP